ncbi:hypothetical protein BT69DRAFT_538566 [Atractiella rhizophila]|nr:hypothetical protein BT69DRAFT_538566 [Atractiella rhizophila]
MAQLRFLAAFAFTAVALAQTPPSRTFTFKNSCKHDVFFQATSGATNNCSEGCIAGSSCNDANGICYWDNPTPSLGNWRIPVGATSTITYAGLDNGNSAAWSGNFAFCEVGTSCTADDATCESAGCSANGPGGKAEFTLVKTGIDYGDLSNIHGVNVPISITPSVTNADSGNPYTCANVGSPNPNTGLGGDSWKFSPPGDEYQWATGGSQASCSSNADCSGGEVCGTAAVNGQLARVCGALSGYWTVNQACVVDGDSGIFGCSNSVTNGAFTGTVGAFQGCGVTSGSCYQPGADNACCGCAQWESMNIGVPASTGDCVNSSPAWTETILPTIQWLKTGSPSGYTFPYDDFSSTFTCQNIENGFNTEGYTIELCPNGIDYLT